MMRKRRCYQTVDDGFTVTFAKHGLSIVFMPNDSVLVITQWESQRFTLDEFEKLLREEKQRRRDG